LFVSPMNAIDSQRALLDSLMGATRDRHEDESIKKVSWRDEEVCKNYLVGFCPFDLFTWTKSDLGSCEKIHSDKLRRQFQAENDRRKKKKYERRYLELLEDLVKNCDRKIDRARKRISMDAEMVVGEEDNLSSAQKERLDAIDDKVKDYTERMEDLGNQGMVEKAQELLLKMEQLKNEKMTIKSLAVGVNETQNLIPCGICGAFMMDLQDESRVDHHLKGKTHQGYQMIRDKIKEFRDRRRSKSPSRSRSRYREKDRLRERSSSGRQSR